MNAQPQITAQEVRNNTVLTSYLAITKVTKQLIATIPQESLRYIIELDCKAFKQIKPKLHELISPNFYLCLREEKGHLGLHFGYDPHKDFAAINNQFIRAIYKLTMAHYTNVDIEDCIQYDSIITGISGLFDEMQFKHPSYPYKAIKYRSVNGRRKILSVA